MREEIRQMGRDARTAAHEMAKIAVRKNGRLEAVAVALERRELPIDAANRKDIAEALVKGLAAAKVDRLRLSDKVLTEMTDGLREIGPASRSRGRNTPPVDPPKRAEGGKNADSARCGGHCL